MEEFLDLEEKADYVANLVAFRQDIYNILDCYAVNDEQKNLKEFLKSLRKFIKESDSVYKYISELKEDLNEFLRDNENIEYNYFSYKDNGRDNGFVVQKQNNNGISNAKYVKLYENGGNDAVYKNHERIYNKYFLNDITAEITLKEYKNFTFVLTDHINGLPMNRIGYFQVEDSYAEFFNGLPEIFINSLVYNLGDIRRSNIIISNLPSYSSAHLIDYFSDLEYRNISDKYEILNEYNIERELYKMNDIIKIVNKSFSIESNNVVDNLKPVYIIAMFYFNQYCLDDENQKHDIENYVSEFKKYTDSIYLDDESLCDVNINDIIYCFDKCSKKLDEINRNIENYDENDKEIVADICMQGIKRYNKISNLLCDYLNINLQVKKIEPSRELNEVYRTADNQANINV